MCYFWSAGVTADLILAGRGGGGGWGWGQKVLSVFNTILYRGGIKVNFNVVPMV